MEEFVARKRVSIYLLFVAWAGSVAMMHPGFAMMVASVFQLIVLLTLRFIAHFEGQYMLKAAEAKYGAAHAGGKVWRRLSIEAAVCIVACVVVVWILERMIHVAPWLWFLPSN